MFWNTFVGLCASIKKSPNAVCKDLGLSNATATYWKHGSIPHATTLLKLANYFGVSETIFNKKTKIHSQPPKNGVSDSEPNISQDNRTIDVILNGVSIPGVTNCSIQRDVETEIVLKIGCTKTTHEITGE